MMFFLVSSGLFFTGVNGADAAGLHGHMRYTMNDQTTSHSLLTT